MLAYRRVLRQMKAGWAALPRPAITLQKLDIHASQSSKRSKSLGYLRPDLTKPDVDTSG
jgi:hypothetical protein